MSAALNTLIQSTKKLKLLYVEDKEETRISTLKFLSHFFYDIAVALDGKDAVDTFFSDKYDIILSDINMPVLNGIEMLETIREYDSEVPIIFLSAYSDSEYFLRSIELGVDYFIVKPIEQEQFITGIRKVVEKIELKKQNKLYQERLEDEVAKRTAQLEHKLHYDELTGLQNRFSFFEHLHKSQLNVLFLVDIDKFKVINEVYGNSVGTKVLCEFSKFLSTMVIETCSIYRLSADEFAVLDSAEYIDLQKYEKYLDTFFRELKDFRVNVDDNSISLDVSIGICTSQDDIFEKAEIALEYAKVHKKHYVMYSAHIDKRKEQSETLKTIDMIKEAIDENRVVPVYQPIVNKDGEVIKYETLMRLQNREDSTLITPYYFLDVAIKARLYPQLSSMVIFEALRIIDTTQNIISINFNYSDIVNKSFINELEAFFTLSPDIGKRSVFEIVESENIQSYDDMKKFISRFRKYGVKIAIDDFGTGFSNFEYILEIRPDYLKIDGSLIKNIDTDVRSHTLVQAIIEFSHKLGITVIAEYVHSKKIFDMLKVLDVDEYQGFYFSEPLANIENTL